METDHHDPASMLFTRLKKRDSSVMSGDENWPWIQQTRKIALGMTCPVPHD